MKSRKTNKVGKFEVKKVKIREQWAKMSFVSRSAHAPLKSVDWSPVYTTPDASAALTLWENILVSSMEQFIPFRTYGAPRPHSKPWFNSFLNRLRRKRNRLFSRSKLLDRNHPLSAAYRKVGNHYVAELRSAERQYYAKQVSALQSARLVNDPRRWWKTAKAACGLNSVDSIPPLFHNNCMKVTAEEFASYFWIYYI